MMIVEIASMAQYPYKYYCQYSGRHASKDPFHLRFHNSCRLSRLYSLGVFPVTFLNTLQK